MAIDDPKSWTFVTHVMSVTTVLTLSPDGATSVRPLLYIAVAACYDLRTSVIW